MVKGGRSLMAKGGRSLTVLGYFFILFVNKGEALRKTRAQPVAKHGRSLAVWSLLFHLESQQAATNCRHWHRKLEVFTNPDINVYRLPCTASLGGLGDSQHLMSTLHNWIT